MKRTIILLATGLTLAVAPSVRAQLNIPSDGSDGVLNVTTSTNIDLSLAVPGRWDTNNSANAGRGVYDTEKWAVVFKYQSVNIAPGATVSFLNHPAHPPVVWLVQSNVTIDGTVDVSGKPGTITIPQNLVPVEPGPGGFRGAPFGALGSGTGFGPGAAGGGGSHNDYTGSYAGSYGNPQIVPLIGGSGGGADGNSGSGAGGAILIAAGSQLMINGYIRANSPSSLSGYGIGSGGAIRLIASQILGVGSLEALPAGRPGRIRIETPTLAGSIIISPESINVAPANPPGLWPPDTAPTVRVRSVAGVNTPAEVTAPLVNSADLAVQVNGNTFVEVETRNFPIEGSVQVRRTPKFGPTAAWYTATFQSGGFTSAVWRASVPLAAGFSALQARATAP